MIPLLTILALVAFAANSLICRLALGGDLIDPVSFTILRLVSGAAVLWPIATLARESTGAPSVASWSSATALFTYAIAFSLAYVWLGAGIGALLLFGAVQVTMLSYGVARGERPGAGQWAGLVAAFAGLVLLMSPGLTAPDVRGAAMMTAAGVAWGAYSVRGRRVTAPITATAGNFARAAVLALPLALVVLLPAGVPRLTPVGALLATLSGTVTSGLGYVAWYSALRGLTATRAAVVQLLVPVITAFGGVLLLAEDISGRLVVASVLILGGVALAVLRR